MTAPAQTPPSTNGQHAPQSRLALRELERALPSPELVAEQAAALQAASVAAISVEDVNEMMTAVLAKAKQGDPKCTRLILDHLNAQRPKQQAGRPPAAPAPTNPPLVLQAREADPPKPVAIEAPGVEQHRRLVAYILLAHQPMSVSGLADQTGLSGEQLDAVLNHDWFCRQNATVKLTPLGRNAVG